MQLSIPLLGVILYVPAGHFSQVIRLESYSPELHCVHAVEPSYGAIYPASQLKHESDEVPVPGR